MLRQLQKIGNSKGVVLTRTMLDHLGVDDQVDVTLQDNAIVIRAPRVQNFEDAMEATFQQYDVTMKKLAE